jgi:hypothetical protein
VEKKNWPKNFFGLKIIFGPKKIVGSKILTHSQKMGKTINLNSQSEQKLSFGLESKVVKNLVCHPGTFKNLDSSFGLESKVVYSNIGWKILKT